MCGRDSYGDWYLCEAGPSSPQYQHQHDIENCDTEDAPRYLEGSGRMEYLVLEEDDTESAIPALGKGKERYVPVLRRKPATNPLRAIEGYMASTDPVTNWSASTPSSSYSPSNLTESTYTASIPLSSISSKSTQPSNDSPPCQSNLGKLKRKSRDEDEYWNFDSLTRKRTHSMDEEVPREKDAVTYKMRKLLAQVHDRRHRV